MYIYIYRNILLNMTGMDFVFSFNDEIHTSASQAAPSYVDLPVTFPTFAPSLNTSTNTS